MTDSLRLLSLTHNAESGLLQAEELELVRRVRRSQTRVVPGHHPRVVRLRTHNGFAVLTPGGTPPPLACSLLNLDPAAHDYASPRAHVAPDGLVKTGESRASERAKGQVRVGGHTWFDRATTLVDRTSTGRTGALSAPRSSVWYQPSFHTACCSAGRFQYL